jgi:hypothetical protein
LSDQEVADMYPDQDHGPGHIDGDPAPNNQERLWYGALAAVLVLVVVLGGVALMLSASDDDAGTDAEEVTTSTETDDTSTTSVQATTTSQATTSTTEPSGQIDLEDWFGDYTWTESVEGADQIVIHRLDLDPGEVVDATLAGRLIETGFQVDNQIEIVVEPIDDSVAVIVESITRGGADYQPGEVLFRLTGDPESPTTVLGELSTLLADLPGTGQYFLPGEGGSTTGEIGSSDGDGQVVSLSGEGLMVVAVDTGGTTAIPFGTDAVAVGETLDRLLGPSITSPADADCPNSADSVREWEDTLRIEVRDGQLIAWSLPPGSPLTTLSGIGLGTPRSEMTRSVVVEVFESPLGVEFSIGSTTAIRGLLQDDSAPAPVIDLWAGERCIFS